MEVFLDLAALIENFGLSLGRMAAHVRLVVGGQPGGRGLAQAASVPVWMAGFGLGLMVIATIARRFFIV